MNSLYVFIIRVIMATAISVLLMRMFYPDKPLFYTVILGGVIISGSYLRYYLRSRYKSK